MTTPALSKIQQATGRVATTREQRQAEVRNKMNHILDAACQRAIVLIREGRPGRAEYVLARATLRCAAVAARNGRCASHAQA